MRCTARRLTTLDNVNGIVADCAGREGDHRQAAQRSYACTTRPRKRSHNGNAMVTRRARWKRFVGQAGDGRRAVQQIERDQHNLASATAKLNDNTTTAGKLFSDPKLYDNLTGLTGRFAAADWRFPAESEEISAHQSDGFLDSRESGEALALCAARQRLWCNSL